MVYLENTQITTMSRIRLKKLLICAGIFVCIIVYLFSSHTRGKDLHNSLTGFNSITEKISDWLEGQVLGISYQERFCKHVRKWNSSSKYPPVKIVARQLNIADGDKVFINGLHCGEWLVALKGTFPNIKLYGVDKDQDSISYVQTLVNGTYKVAQPFELNKVEFPDSLQFDHAIVDGILSIYSQDLQCQAITQMIPMLKFGGSMYIGKNFEQCDQHPKVELHLQNYLHIQVLPRCYWSKVCLAGRHDLAEILYSKENIMLSENVHVPTKENNFLEKKKEKLLTDFSDCATSIFVNRHISLTSNKDNRIIPESKYSHHKHNHICTLSETVNSTKLGKFMDSDEIKKAVASMKLHALDLP